MMKEYKYKINGNVYKVVIGDIEDNIVYVEVNGIFYKVEMEKVLKVVVKLVVCFVLISFVLVLVIVVKFVVIFIGKLGVKFLLLGVIFDIKVNVGDIVKKG